MTYADLDSPGSAGTLALCNDCGAVRRINSLRPSLRRDYAPAEPRTWGEDDRCMIWRKCQPCGEITRHAYIRRDEDRNAVENAQQILAGFEADEARAADEIEQELRALGIRVLDGGQDGRRVLIAHVLDDDAFVVFLGSDLRGSARAQALRWASQILWAYDGSGDGWRITAVSEETPPMAYRGWSMYAGARVAFGPPKDPRSPA